MATFKKRITKSIDIFGVHGFFGRYAAHTQYGDQLWVMWLRIKPLNWGLMLSNRSPYGVLIERL